MAESVAGRCIVLNAPLCFVVSKFNKVTTMKIVEILLDFFSPEDISTAKKQLVDDVQRLQLSIPQLRSRRDADLRSRQRKEAEDIVDIISTVDLRGLSLCLPVYAADNTDSIPTLKLEDGELRHFLIKVAKLEDAILLMQATVNKMYNCMYKSISHADRPPHELLALLEATTVTQPGHDNRQFTTPAFKQTRVQRQNESTQAPGLRSMSESNNNTRATNSTEPVDIEPSHSQSNIGQNGVGGASGSRWADCHPTTSESSAVETDDAAEGRSGDGGGDFTLVESHRAKRRRIRRSPGNEASGPRDGGQSAAPSGQPVKAPAPSFAAAAKKPPRKPLVVGALRSPPPLSSTGQVASASIAGGKKLTAARPLLGKAVFCVDNVSKDVTADDVMQFVARMGVRVLECNNAKPRRSRKQKANDEVPDHKAFYLCINKADTNLLLDPSKWPADVTVSAWFFKKKDDEQQQTMITPSRSATVAVSAAAASAATAAAASPRAAPVETPTATTDVITATGSITVSADVHHSAAAADAESMELSPIVDNIAANNDHSDASDTMQDDALNSTSIHVVDLSTIVTS